MTAPSTPVLSQWRQMEQLATSKRVPNSSAGDTVGARGGESEVAQWGAVMVRNPPRQHDPTPKSSFKPLSSSHQGTSTTVLG